MLKQLRIRDFRSVTDITLDVSDLNILVGRNDTGKSNILRALNLFFNNETDFRKRFDFNIDYSRNARVRQGKASEIRIDLTLDVPSGYQSNGAKSIEWSKRWRKGEEISDPPMFVFSGNRKSKIGPRSNIHSYLSSIDYHYIPALKGKEFFSELLADIYDVLSEVSAEDLNRASEPLQNRVTEILTGVSKELEEILKGPSDPKLPANLRSVFRLIQFETNGIDLDRRGDGIRVRHVPSLIKFLCDLKSQQAGRYKSFHVWGLEEPENSVDFIAAFEMRDQILGIAKDRQFQILMATHSPIFFSLESNSGVSTNFFAQQNAETVVADGVGDISDEMGVLRVVYPYVERSRVEVEQIRSTLEGLTQRLENDVLDPSRRIVFVEGDSDVAVLTAVNEELKIIKDVRFIASIGEAGSSANSVADNAVAWHFLQKNRHPGHRVKGIGLVDGDAAGEHAIDRFQSRMEGEDNFQSKLIRVRPTKELVTIYKSSGFSPKICLETLFPLEMWIDAKNKGWLEKRTSKDIFKYCDSSKRDDVLNDGISSLVEYNETIHVFYDVKVGKKKEFSEIFLSALADYPELAKPFRDTLLEIRSKLFDLI